MKPIEQAELWSGIAAFRLDDEPVALTFADRLAKENGWSRRLSARAIKEYRRFLFLAMVAGHPVAPSEAVDQVWHLHLTYTRSYWQRLCRETLGRPLHHEPTRGGSAEQTKFVDWYERTLASYRRLFACEPPADLWPDAATRFGADTRHRLVNTARHWIIPKRPLRVAGAVVAGLAALAVVAGGGAPLAQVVNPLDLPGPDFLKLYGVLAVVALAAAFLVRRWLRPDAADDPRPIDECRFEDIAMLVGGPRRAAQAALAALVERGAVTIESWSTKVQVKRVDHCQIDNSPLERALYDAIGPVGRDVSSVTGLVRAETNALVNDLRERGLLLEPEEARRVRLVPAAILGGLFLLGVVKLWVGAQRHRPIGILIVCVFLTLAAALAILAIPCWRTRAGDRLLRKLRTLHSSQKSQYAVAFPSAEVAALTFALFGVTALSLNTGRLSSLRSAFRNQTSLGGGCSTALGAGCSAGGGGGGCGGGGCGGGGCGGCSG